MNLKRINWVHAAIFIAIGYVIRGLGGIGATVKRL